MLFECLFFGGIFFQIFLPLNKFHIQLTQFSRLSLNYVFLNVPPNVMRNRLVIKINLQKEPFYTIDVNTKTV